MRLAAAATDVPVLPRGPHPWWKALALHPWLLALLLASPGASGQYPVWSALYHGIATAHNVVWGKDAVAVSSAGKVAIATAFADQFEGRKSWRIARYSVATGQLEWQVVHRMSLGDQPQAVAFDAQGDIVVTGASGDHSVRGLMTAKFRGTDGAVMWVGAAIATEVIGRSVDVDAEGDVVVLALSETSSQVARIVKYAGADGTLRWERASDGVAAIALTASGDVLAAGSRAGPYPASDAYAARYRGADGSLAWERTWAAPGGAPATASAVEIDGNGDAVVAGNVSPTTLLAQKLAGATGAVVWTTTLDTGVVGITAPLLAVDPAGNPVVVANYAHTLKLAGATGTVIWDRHEQPPYAVLQTVVRMDGAGGIVTFGAGSAGTMWTRKLAGDGTVAWTVASAGNCCGALALAPDGAPVVAGNAGNSYESDLLLARLDPATGATSWTSAPTFGPAETQAGYPEPRCCDAVPTAARSVALDAVGNAFAAGASYNGNGTSIEIVKRRAQDGALLWSRTLEYGAGMRAQAIAIAVDRNGNPIVAGSAWRNGPPFENAWHVVKLAAADGALQWDRGLVDKSGPFAQPYAIAIGAGGDAFVTGTTYVFDIGIHFQTVRLAAADGSVVWKQVFTTPGATTEVARAIALDPAGDVVVAGEFGGFGVASATQAIKYRGTDGTLLWRAVVEGGLDRGGGMGVDATGDVTVAAVYGSTVMFGASRLSGATGAQIWRQPGWYSANFAPSTLALDHAGNAVLLDAGIGGLHVRKLAAVNGSPYWVTSLPLAGACDVVMTGGEVDGNEDVYAAIRVKAQTGPTCADTTLSQHLVKLQGGDGAVVAERVLADADLLYALAARGEDLYLGGRGHGANGLPGLQVMKLTGTPQAALPGTGTVKANPYGALSVQGAALAGTTLTQWQPVAVIDLGTTDAGAGSAAQIDFAGFGVPAGGSLTVRSGAANQTLVLANVDSSTTVIRGALRAEGRNGAPPPVLHVHNRNGIAVDPSGVIVAPGGAIVDALAATADSGSSIVNGGRIDGGPTLALFAGGVHGDGEFAGDDVTLSTFGNANQPAHGSFFLENGLRFAPKSAAAITLTANLYGAAPQFVNLAIMGNLVFALPSSWAPGVPLPLNNAVVPPGGNRPAGVPNPPYGGGSIIVQASGALTLAGGSSGDLAFPGGIVLKAGTAIDFNGVRVDQGWTTSGQPFQGLFFEAPAIGNSKGLIEIYSNQQNWSNFSSFPTSFVRAFTLQRNGNGSASFATADTVAPHLNTYSLLIDAAARGRCWTCLQSTQAVNMFGP